MKANFSFESVTDGQLSVDQPIGRRRQNKNNGYQWTEEWWEENKDRVTRCVGHRKNGNQCKHAALNGTTVCAYHGGRSPQVIHRAKVRIAEATDRNAKFLLEMAADKTIPEGVRLAAIRDALDRGGLNTKQEITVSQKPYELVFDGIQGGPREIEPAHNSEDDPDPEDEPGSLKARLVTRLMQNEYSDLEP